MTYTCVLSLLLDLKGCGTFYNERHFQILRLVTPCSCVNLNCTFTALNLFCYNRLLAVTVTARVLSCENAQGLTLETSCPYLRNCQCVG